MMSEPDHIGMEELRARLQQCLAPDEQRIASAAGYGNRCGWGNRPALLVVDATYSFCGRAPKPILEAIAEQRRSCGEAAWIAIPRVVALIDEARSANIPVIFSAMEDPASPEYEPGLWRAKNRRGTEDGQTLSNSGQGDNQILEEIAPLAGEMVVSKNKPSLFSGTGILPYLISQRVDSLIICGGTTSGCVYATALDGFSYNFKISVVEDASFDRIPSVHWMFLLDIDLKYGDVVTSGAAIEFMRTLRVAGGRRNA